MAKIKTTRDFAAIAVRTSSAYAPSVQHATPQPPGFVVNVALPSIQWPINETKTRKASESW
jgi:hypothetical protein